MAFTYVTRHIKIPFNSFSLVLHNSRVQRAEEQGTRTHSATHSATGAESVLHDANAVSSPYFLAA